MTIRCARCGEPLEVDDGEDVPWICFGCRTPLDEREREKEREKTEFMVRLYERRDPAFGAHLREMLELVDDLEQKTRKLRGN